MSKTKTTIDPHTATHDGRLVTVGPVVIDCGASNSELGVQLLAKLHACHAITLENGGSS